MFTKRIRRASAWLVSLGLMGGAAVAAAEGDKRGMHDKSGMHEKGESKKVTKAKAINGRVLAIKSVGIRGTNQRHLVALVRTPDGVREVVDLGPRSDARKLDLAVGDRISVRGHETKVKNQKILIADRARSAGAILTIDRSMQRKHFDRGMRKAHADAGMCPPMDEG